MLIIYCRVTNHLQTGWPKNHFICSQFCGSRNSSGRAWLGDPSLIRVATAWVARMSQCTDMAPSLTFWACEQGWLAFDVDCQREAGARAVICRALHVVCLCGCGASQHSSRWIPKDSVPEGAFQEIGSGGYQTFNAWIKRLA